MPQGANTGNCTVTKPVNDLNPAFRVKLDFVLRLAREAGVHLEIFWKVLSPEDQAKLWKKSRSAQEIGQAVTKLRSSGAPFLADVLEKTHTEKGRWETADLPGQSWHQWGEAAAVRVVSETGRTIWSPNHPDYRVLADIAKQVSLSSGFNWSNRDVTHLQLRPDASRAYYPWSQIDREMKRRWS